MVDGERASHLAAGLKRVVEERITVSVDVRRRRIAIEERIGRRCRAHGDRELEAALEASELKSLFEAGGVVGSPTGYCRHASYLECLKNLDDLAFVRGPESVRGPNVERESVPTRCFERLGAFEDGVDQRGVGRLVLHGEEREQKNTNIHDCLEAST